MPIIAGYDVSDQVLELIQEVAAEHRVAPFWVLGIVLAESGGDPTARNVTEYEDSVGLLQLNRFGGQGQGYTVTELLYPRRNLELGIPYITQAIARCRPNTVPTDTQMYCMFINSGHPGRGPTFQDPRIQRLIELTKAAWEYLDPHAPPPPPQIAPASKVTLTLTRDVAVRMVRDLHLLIARLCEGIAETDRGK